MPLRRFPPCGALAGPQGSVDISKTRLDAHRLRDGEAAQFGNDAAGFKRLAHWIGSADCVVYEATGRYHRDFEESLVRARVCR